MKTPLLFGLGSGAVSAAMTAATVPLLDTIGIRNTDLLGYTTIGVVALLVFFGVRSYRETVCGGRIGFGRALGVGLLITLVSSLCTVLAFQAVYFWLTPEFGDTFVACMIERARLSGTAGAALDEVSRQAARLKRLYDDPLVNAALTFGQSFTIGLAASVLSAAALRRPAARAARSSRPQPRAAAR